ncbi:DUF6894 family protein [Sphingomonas sp. 179-I 2A4 NHS]|jgi:hypothetical protein|uniref:DUF6894 family protein n=1 Tax=unclassified Sphingomonas TaxID=196159 RepID=UPI00387A1B35
MARYRIELRTPAGVQATRNVEKDDLAALRHEAALFASDMLRARASQVWDDGDWSIEASDATGLILFVLHLFVTNAAALTEPRR